MRRQITGRCTYVRCNPLVDASGGQEQYYVKSAWHSQSHVRSAWHFQEIAIQLRRHLTVRCTPSRGIWWPRAVLHQVRSAWYLQSHVRSAWHLQSDICRSDVPPSRGIWWPRAVLHQARSAWYLQSHVRSAWHLQSDIPKSHVLYAMQENEYCYSIYICIFIDQDMYVKWSFCCCCSCCCYCVIVLLQQKQNETWKRTATRTKRSIYIHVLFNYH